MSDGIDTGRLCLKSWLRAYRTPVSLYVLYCLSLLVTGYQLFIPYEFMQLPPMGAVIKSPLKSLLLLHCQPPLMTVLVWLVRAPSDWLGIPAEGPAVFINGLLGLGACVLWFDCARRLTRSEWLGGLVVALLLANPAFRLFQGYFFYDHLLLFHIGLLPFLCRRWSERLAKSWLAALLLWLVMLIYLRALFHPVYTLGLAALLGLHAGSREGWRRGAATFLVSMAVCVAAISPWLIKNRIIFGSASFSTLLGWNIASDEEGLLKRFGHTGEYDELLVAEYYDPGTLAWLKAEPMTALLEKPGTIGPPIARRNMNHYAVPALNAHDTAVYIRKMWDNPDMYARRCLRYLFDSYDLPSYVNPYTGGSDLRGYGRWFAMIYEGWWLRGAWRLEVAGVPVTGSLFLIVLLPASVVFGVWRGRRIGDADGLVCAAIVYTMLWVMAMCVFVDGGEATRHRWPVEPVYLVLLVAGAQRLACALRARNQGATGSIAPTR